MSFKSYVRKKLALSEQGYKNLMAASLSSFVNDIMLMLPVMVIFGLICDVLGGNEYDFDLEPWLYIVLSMVAIGLIAFTYVFVYDNSFYRVYRESGALRISMAEKIRKLPLSYFARKDPTDLTVRMLGDVTVQEQALTHWFPETIGAVLFTTLMSIGIIIWCPPMGAAAIWPVPIAFAIVLFSGRLQRRFSDKKNRMDLENAEGIQECLENARDLKGNDAGAKYLDRLFDGIDRFEKHQLKSELVMAVFVNLAMFILKFGIVTTAIVGAYLLGTGGISLPVFIMFIILISRFYDPLNGSLMFLSAMISSMYNMERMQEINDETEQNGSTDFHPDGYDIVFDGVGFSYDGKNDILKDVSFTAKQGEVTALIGPSGEGKSTVAKLSSRFWDIDKGKITVGGVDISTVDPETLLSCYSIVFQDVVLFNSSVMDNLRIGKQGASDEEVLKAAKLAMCDEFVNQLPEGYDTVIGENGAKLSGGERQRISIARAILKDAPIVLLDEATASLDTECESQVQQALSTLVKDKTVIIVAHRMRTIEDADKIVVLKNGTVSEQGSPEELRAQDGTFSRMVRLQSDAQNWSI